MAQHGGGGSVGGTTSAQAGPAASTVTPQLPLRGIDSALGGAGGIGQNVRRPDGIAKVQGEFAYSSDLSADGMLFGATHRSPHPRARIVSVDVTEAVLVPGVQAVLTADDVPGAATYGMEVPDQPVLASTEVRYQGEAIAIVAADHPETARRAVERIRVEYEVLDPVVDSQAALAEGSPLVHAQPVNGHGVRNVTRYVPIRSGAVGDDGVVPPEVRALADVVVRGEYEVGMQDQAFLGPESGLAVPDDVGGVDLYISTQWLHVDRDQLANVLALRNDQVRLTLAGVGGAFGAREDLSIQAHCCMLAMHTGKPVKMEYGREESFFGHVHRHPAKMRYEHGATRDGTLVYVDCDLVLDGGAYASSSTAVAANAASFALGPYEVPHASIDSWVAYTNNPPCGAMRGFGAVQVCFAHEAQMDKVAAACGLDPYEVRLRNAMAEGSLMPTGQVVVGAAPVRELLEALRDMPLPDEPQAGGDGLHGTGWEDGMRPDRDVRALPGGVGSTTRGEGVRRGSGIAVGFKNICFAEGFDDFSTARVRLALDAHGEPVAFVHTAAAEVGQGLTTIQMQIARTELGVEQVVVLPADTQVGSAGSSSASRQTYLTGGAVKVACEAIRQQLEDARTPAEAEAIDSWGDAPGATVAELLARVGGQLEETREFRHFTTKPLDPERGQGDAHVQFAFAAHRVTADVDVDLGLVRLVQVDTVQDVGKALNPQAVEGQIEGGTAQGLGLALMEEIQVTAGKVRNPSFTDYLIPTILDMPPVNMRIFEFADPRAPYGVRGVGEPPTISSGPAAMAAMRAASGRDLTYAPVHPDHIVGLA